MKIDLDAFRVADGGAADLSRRPTRIKPLYKSKKEYERVLARQVELKRERQAMLYAHNRYALLLVFQAMDAAGKDGAIKHVMSGINPQGCQVHGFGPPGTGEMDHDFLWRVYRRLPERGRIGIFNRSHYEEVLIVRVHPEILKNRPLPPEIMADTDIWRHRFRSINDMEKHLHFNGTRIVKFFLHLSKEEQRKRFLARIDKPDKNWKFNQGDVDERGRWDDYQHAYEECLTATSKEHAPWYVVPADDKKNARLIVSQVILETLKGMDLHFPKVSAAQKKELQIARRRLLAEDDRK